MRLEYNLKLYQSYTHFTVLYQAMNQVIYDYSDSPVFLNKQQLDKLDGKFEISDYNCTLATSERVTYMFKLRTYVFRYLGIEIMCDECLPTDGVVLYEGPSVHESNCIWKDSLSMKKGSGKLKLEGFQALIIIHRLVSADSSITVHFQQNIRDTNIREVNVTEGSKLLSISDDDHCKKSKKLVMCDFRLVAPWNEYVRLVLSEMQHDVSDSPDCDQFGLSLSSVHSNIHQVYKVHKHKLVMADTDVLQEVYQSVLTCENYPDPTLYFWWESHWKTERSFHSTTSQLAVTWYYYSAFLADKPSLTLELRSTKTQGIPSHTPHREKVALNKHPKKVPTERVNASFMHNDVHHVCYHCNLQNLLLVRSKRARDLYHFELHFAFGAVKEPRNMVDPYKIDKIYEQKICFPEEFHTMGIMNFDSALYCNYGIAQSNTGFLARKESKEIHVTFWSANLIGIYQYLHIYTKYPKTSMYSIGGEFFISRVYIIHAEASLICNMTTGLTFRSVNTNMFNLLYSAQKNFDTFIMGLFLVYDQCQYISLITENSCHFKSCTEYEELSQDNSIRNSTFGSGLCPLYDIKTYLFHHSVLPKRYLVMKFMVYAHRGKSALNIKLNCDNSSEVSFNISDFVGIGNKAEFWRVKQKSFLLYSYGTEYLRNRFYLDYYVAYVQVSYLHPFCSGIIVEMKKGTIKHRGQNPITHIVVPGDTSTNKREANKIDKNTLFATIYSNHVHALFNPEVERLNLDREDVSNVCSSLNYAYRELYHVKGFKLLTYFSDQELSTLHAVLIEEGYHGAPTVVFTGFKKDKVCTLCNTKTWQRSFSKYCRNMNHGYIWLIGQPDKI